MLSESRDWNIPFLICNWHYVPLAFEAMGILEDTSVSSYYSLGFKPQIVLCFCYNSMGIPVGNYFISLATLLFYFSKFWAAQKKCKRHTSQGKNWKGWGGSRNFWPECQNLDQPWLDLSLNRQSHALTHPVFLQSLSNVAWSSILPRHDMHLLLQIEGFHCFQTALKIKQLNLHPETVSLKHHTPLQFWPGFSCQCLKKQVFGKSHKAHLAVMQTPSLVKHAVNVMLRQSRFIIFQ